MPAAMFRSCLIALTSLLPLGVFSQTTVPIVVSTNTTIRVMASNLTSGNNQRYESPGLNILKGLKPDIVAVQEFGYSSTNGQGLNTANAFREMVNATFGTNFVYYREPSTYNIPNGIISRYPILSSGSWDDIQVSDRGFAWARIDIPGTNDLYVVSVHLHSGGGPSSRQIEATNINGYIQANFPANAWVVVAGDFNTDSRGEACVGTFKLLLSDDKIPTDQQSDPDTNAGRAKPYDYVLPSYSLSSYQIASVIGGNSYANGLVFDSRVYSPLSDVSPVLSTDSAATNMQHMGVIKDFKITYTTTNNVIVPKLSTTNSNVLRWSGSSNLTYTVQRSTVLGSWTNAGTATSTTTNFTFTNNVSSPTNRWFYRVTYP
jgi:endonuclease/exonuclease/phosphatase family metal-dependent hydrolase